MEGHGKGQQVFQVVSAHAIIIQISDSCQAKA
jgi:hypothetical protein